MSQFTHTFVSGLEFLKLIYERYIFVILRCKTDKKKFLCITLDTKVVLASAP